MGGFPCGRRAHERLLAGCVSVVLVLGWAADGEAVSAGGRDPDLPEPGDGRPSFVSPVADERIPPGPPTQPDATGAPKPSLVAPPDRAEITVKWVGQTWNNCGPASVSMLLSAQGLDVSQETLRVPLRGDDIRRGMPAQSVDPWVWAKLGLRAIVRTNGTGDLLKRLVANGYPVMTTQWLEDPGGYAGFRISHYRVVRGYDDARRVFIVADPLRGPITLDYAWFEGAWQPFLYRYLVIYHPSEEAKVRAIIGEDWDEERMRLNGYARLRAEAFGSRDVYAWAAYGEAAYRAGFFAESVAAFERAMALGWPDGLFTIRSSYPAALVRVGRVEEARAMLAKLGRVIPYAMPVEIAVDPLALALESRRAERLPLDLLF